MTFERFEFGANMDSINGILNYEIFQETCLIVMQEFWNTFSFEVMHKYPLLIDNATMGSGHTPKITPVLDKFLIIKLGIVDGKSIGQTIFQFAHELTHLVFYSYLGLDKTHADDIEESLCSAVSIALVKKLKPNEVSMFTKSLLNSDYQGYKDGVKVVKDHNFSFDELKNTILEEIEKRKR